MIVIGIAVIIVLVSVLIYQKLIKTEEISFEGEITMPEKVLQGKSIAMIIAFRDFRDVEYFIPRDTLVGVGAEVITISTEKGTAIGADGGEAKVDLVVSDFRLEDFDAVVFVGGPGMGQKLDNESFQKIAKDTVEADKVLGAICISPALLAKAGVLEGKKATVWSSVMDKSAVKILEENGANYVSEPVVVDGKIVTADGPLSAKRFAEELVVVLTQ